VVGVKRAETSEKQNWRASLSVRRASVPATVRAAEAIALAAAMPALAPGPGDWVAAYVPVRGEPGSVAMLDALRTGGARVLLPVTGPPGPLDWAEYTGPESLRRGRFGLLEPVGPQLGTAAVTRPRVILIPALAVDKRGVRLGRGAGYYDRTLTAARPDARLVAVVRDDELVDRLPEEPHDLRMGWALTPQAGLRPLDSAECE
jgi:5-formyltetrahydrofolate cyclo-ligase